MSKTTKQSVLNMFVVRSPAHDKSKLKPNNNRSKEKKDNKPDIIIAFKNENVEKLHELTERIKVISGEEYTPQNIIHLGLNLVSLAVELQASGGGLFARTLEGEEELNITRSETSKKSQSDRKHSLAN